jgi:hypothetical protein
LTGNELVVSAMRPTLSSGEEVEYRIAPQTNVANNAATEG